jgi:S1-C subfamily serine protease
VFKPARTLLIFVFSLSVVLSGCGIFGDAEADATTPTAIPSPSPEATPTPTEAPPAELSWEDVVERLGTSVVLVRADFPSTVVSYEGQGSGSGIVYTDDGYIITNAHVVSGAAAITVAAAGTTRERSARIVGVSDCDDIAVLKIDDMDGLEPATLGSSRDQRIGAEVAALGYPLGSAIGTDLTVSRGVISKLDEPLLYFESLIQHDASLSPGNSGGPLVNRNAEVVGINTLGFDASVAQNINFAISMDQAKPVIETLQEGKNRHWLGMNLEPNLYLDYFGTEAGLVVAAISSGSSASSVGVRPAFLLTHLQGLSVNSKEDVCRILRSHKDGDAMKVEFMHITETEIQYLEGEIVLGAGSGGTNVSVVYREDIAGGELPTGEGDDVLTIGTWSGVAEVTIDYWAPCGAGGSWIPYDTQTYYFDVGVYVDVPYDGEFNPFSLGIWTDPIEEEGGFVLITSDVVDIDGVATVIEYWEVDYDGIDVGGELVETGIDFDSPTSMLVTYMADDPCSEGQPMALTSLIMDVGTVFSGYLGPNDGYLEIRGETYDLSRDFVIIIELDRMS